MADTALTIITDALLDLGVLADEETPSASQAQGGLRKLNNMIDAWNIDHLMVYGANSYTLPLVANQGVYTIGTGGNLNISRPANITAAYLRDTTLPAATRQDIPLYIANDQEWQEVAFKGMAAQYPYNLIWFNMTNPLISAYLNPIPNTSQFSLVIWSSGLISNLLLNDEITLAPGYKRALTANLCVELAGSYQVPVPDTVQSIAVTSKGALQVNNLQINELEIPLALQGYGYFDINTGDYR